MIDVDESEASADLCRLLEAVECGEQVVIWRDGRPVARLVRVVARVPGGWAGALEVEDGFDDELPEGWVEPWAG